MIPAWAIQWLCDICDGHKDRLDKDDERLNDLEKRVKTLEEKVGI